MQKVPTFHELARNSLDATRDTVKQCDDPEKAKQDLLKYLRQKGCLDLIVGLAVDAVAATRLPPKPAANPPAANTPGPSPAPNQPGPSKVSTKTTAQNNITYLLDMDLGGILLKNAQRKDIKSAAVRFHRHGTEAIANGELLQKKGRFLESVYKELSAGQIAGQAISQKTFIDLWSAA